MDLRYLNISNDIVVWSMWQNAPILVGFLLMGAALCLIFCFYRVGCCRCAPRYEPEDVELEELGPE